MQNYYHKATFLGRGEFPLNLAELLGAQPDTEEDAARVCGTGRRVITVSTVSSKHVIDWLPITWAAEGWCLQMSSCSPLFGVNRPAEEVAKNG